MTISEEEYLTVSNGYNTAFNIAVRKIIEFEQKVKDLRELRETDLSLLQEKENQIIVLRENNSTLQEQIKFLTHGKEPTSSKQ